MTEVIFMAEEKTAKKEKITKGEKSQAKPEAKNKKSSGLSRLAKVVGRKQAQPAAEKTVAFAGDPYDVLKFVLMTEKAVRQIELQNKLVFIVDRKSDKGEIKAAANAAFNSPISEVRTLIDQAGRKKAFIRFSQAGAAGDIAIRLGII